MSGEWLDRWSDNKYQVLDRLMSDQCALVLNTVTMDWGPKPFRSLDVWHKDSRFREFVRNKWLSYEVQGGDICFQREVEDVEI